MYLVCKGHCFHLGSVSMITLVLVGMCWVSICTLCYHSWHFLFFSIEQIGQEMLENLSHDREKIQRARERVSMNHAIIYMFLNSLGWTPDSDGVAVRTGVQERRGWTRATYRKRKQELEMVDEVADSAHLRVPSVVRNRPLRELWDASVFQNKDCENRQYPHSSSASFPLRL